MTSITWASLRYVQELTTILGPQNRTQGSCVWQCVHQGGSLTITITTDVRTGMIFVVCCVT